MIEICNETYRELAALMREAIGDGEFFSGVVELEKENFSARLIVTIIVYRRTEILPEGVRKPIADVVPIWWELRTTDLDGPADNDFSFSELKPYLADHE